MKQFVARIAREHVRKDLAVESIRIESGTAANVGDFLSQQRDQVGTLGVHVRRVQPEKALLAHHFTGGIETLHGDVVRIRRTVYLRARAGLRKREQRAFQQKRARIIRLIRQQAFRRWLPVPQYSEFAIRDLLDGSTAEVELAVAEKREVAFEQPLEKRDRLAYLFCSQRRRRRLQRSDDRVQALFHDRKIANAGADVLQDRIELLDERRQPFFLQPIDLRIDHYLCTRLARLRIDMQQIPIGIAHRCEHYVLQVVSYQTAMRQLHQHRVGDERHVRMRDLHDSVQR